MKETFYLRHDYNSRSDERVLRLRQKYPNGAGYALFWMVLEKLAESSEGRIKLSDIDVVAFEIQMESKWIKDVVLESGLFENDEVFFWSNRLLSDLAERDEKSKRAIFANKLRWDKVRKEATKNPNGVQMDSEMESKERRGEERKGKEKRGVGAAATIKKTLKLPGSFPVEEIEKIIEKYPRTDLEALAVKILGSNLSRPYGELWKRFVSWSATEKEKVAPKEKGKPSELEQRQLARYTNIKDLKHD